MSRHIRAQEGGVVYHAINRANARACLFDDRGDYQAFERVLGEAIARESMRLLAYCVMPNHFHLVLWPRADGDLSRFMGWLTMTHTQRWHAHRNTVGSGHLYQGRFKSFPVQSDEHLLILCRYVERNPLRAGLVTRAEHWPWGSLAKSTTVPSIDNSLLHPWVIERPGDWVERVNAAMTPAEEEAVQRSIQRNQPFGTSDWQETTASRLGLLSTLRPRGRPKKNPINGS